MEYRECRTCAEYLPIEAFYIYHNEKTGNTRLGNPDCKECDRANTRRKSAEQKGNVGSERVGIKPNTYVDENQKKQTFEFLKLMGWKFNEERGIWYDDIKKTSDGIFVGVWSPKQKIRPKLVFTESNPPKIKFKNERKADLPSEELVNKIVFDYYVNNIRIKDLAVKYNVNSNTIQTYTKYLYNQEMAKRRKSDIIPINKTLLKRKKHFKKELPKIIPTVVLSKDKVMFTPEIIKQVQYDYFMGDLKFYEVVQKYADFDAKTVAYIIRKTLTVIKLNKDADKN